jgi:anti-sigma factor (TIGR02949 family)
MLDCQAMQRFLHPYLDGELNTRDAVEIQAHLDACPNCMAQYRNEKLFLDLLKKSLPRSHAPIGFDLKVKQALDAICERNVSRVWFRRVLAPAIAVAGIVVLTMTLLVGKEAVPEFVDAAVATHESYASKNMQLTIESHEPAQVSRRLQEQAGFPVSLARSPVRNLKLVGGRLVELHGKKAVFLAYDVGGRPLSLFMTTAQGVKLFGSQEMVDKEVRFYQSPYHGLQTLSWTLEGMAYVFVSDTQELNKQACQVCHNATRYLQSPTGRQTKLL